jgi:hypothetical protein
LVQAAQAAHTPATQELFVAATAMPVSLGALQQQVAALEVHILVQHKKMVQPADQAEAARAQTFMV